MANSSKPNADYLKNVSTKISEGQVLMNRNTSPTRPLSDEALMEAVLATPFNQYPDEEEAKFIEAYAAFNGLDPDQVAVANGSDEWLQKLIIQFGKEGVLALAPDFFMYEDYTNQLGYDFNTISANDQFEFDVNQIIDGLDRFKPSILFVSNPQNPTGQQFTSEFLQILADATETRQIVFVIDEAYMEFGDDYQRPDNGNVIYVRTLSKIYGVAGLRVGIAFGKGDVFNKLIQINHPYPMNSLSLNIANKLFEDPDQLQAWQENQLYLRQRLVQAFDQVADLVNIIPSHTNFVFMYGDYVPEFATYLTEKGYIGRTYTDSQMAKAARFSIVAEEEYDRLTAMIGEWRKQVGN